MKYKANNEKKNNKAKVGALKILLNYLKHR